MKKIFSLLMAVTIVATALAFNTRSASAAPLGLLVYVEAFKGKDAGTQMPAQFWADSDWHSVYCVMTDTAGYVSCKFPEKYSGQSVTLKLNDSLVFYVTVPAKQENTTPTCTAPQVVGADVKFTIGVPFFSASTVTYFVSGNTLGDVATNAQAWVNNSNGYYTNYTIVSGLHCGVQPT